MYSERREGPNELRSSDIIVAHQYTCEILVISLTLQKGEPQK